jgi:DNA-binding IclR family transcriptional regulator
MRELGMASAEHPGSRRSLSTARAVLRVLSMLAEHPDGVGAEEVAHGLGKSVSTAYYLLTSLCAEGYAVHERRGVYRAAEVAEQPTAVRDDLARMVDELFLRTRKRSYLGVVKPGSIEIVAFAGRQGVPRMPGLGSEIRDSAHALAMGKVVLALLGPRAIRHYAARGLTAFTPNTISSADALAAELELVREQGYAVDCEEFDENFCCVAAPIFNEHRRFVAALGLSTTKHVFDRDRARLAEAVLTVAGSSEELASRCKNSALLAVSGTAP